MEVSVIVEPVAGQRFRAIGAGGLSLGLSAEGTTAQEAMDRLAQQVQTRLHSGATIADLNVGEAARWKADAGYLRDEPSFEPWREAMKEYRRKLDEDPEAL